MCVVVRVNGVRVYVREVCSCVMWVFLVCAFVCLFLVRLFECVWVRRLNAIKCNSNVYISIKEKRALYFVNLVRQVAAVAQSPSSFMSVTVIPY